MNPVYFQIQYTNKDGDSVHSDGCCPVGHKYEEGDSFRDLAHQLLDEFLSAHEHDGVKPSENILGGDHLVFSACSEHD